MSTPAPLVYLVGGAVRDGLLGRPVHERDWVVVGATREAMLAQGYRQVGRDFPVFLHPATQEEYALARTERKRGAGHVAFEVHAAPDVTLEDDLRRRDLTINAIARAADGALIDPYGGREDLAARVLRHVSPAFVEDPLRVFRVARFAAQLADYGFHVAGDTRALMRAIAASGELASLSAERVWAELAKALRAGRGARFVQVLREADALAPWFDAWRHDDPVDLDAGALAGLDAAVAAEWALAARYAAFCARLDASEVVLANGRLKPPRACIDLARLYAAEHVALARWQAATPEDLLALLQRCDALRRGERFGVLCAVVGAIDGGEAPACAARARALAALPVQLPAGVDPAAAVRAQRLEALAALAAART